MALPFRIIKQVHSFFQETTSVQFDIRECQKNLWYGKSRERWQEPGAQWKMLTNATLSFWVLRPSKPSPHKRNVSIKLLTQVYCSCSMVSQQASLQLIPMGFDVFKPWKHKVELASLQFPIEPQPCLAWTCHLHHYRKKIKWP